MSDGLDDDEHNSADDDHEHDRSADHYHYHHNHDAGTRPHAKHHRP